MNGRVRTLDEGNPEASAIAVAGGRLVCVGSDAEALACRDGGTEVIDLRGAAAVPGLVDSHIHPFPGHFVSGGIDLMDARSLAEVEAAVAAAARRARPGEWITGYGLDYDLFEETGIRGSLLAEAAGGAPVLLMFVDLHTAIASPLALELAGVTGPRDFGENAEIVCEDGAPTGELREIAAVASVSAAMPAVTAAETYRRSVEILGQLAAVGITAVHAMDGDLARLDLLRELEGNGDLTARVLTPFWLTPESERSDWAEFAAARDERGRRWRAGVAKFFIDGVVDAGTAWLFEPDSEGEGTEPFWPDPARYREAVAFMSGKGFQCVTHACGDRAVHEALNAYREAGAPPGVRHRVEHVETIREADLPRFAAEGVIASMQPQHMEGLRPDRSDNYSRRLGGERGARTFRTRDLLAGGAQLTFGSDWPVARFDPREGMAVARLRRPPGDRGRVPFDDQAISALDALRGYTLWPALTAGESAQAGILTAGRRADVTVFATDPVECDADELPDDEVLMTMVDGEVVHRRLD